MLMNEFHNAIFAELCNHLFKYVMDFELVWDCLVCDIDLLFLFGLVDFITIIIYYALIIFIQYVLIDIVHRYSLETL